MPRHRIIWAFCVLVGSASAPAAMADRRDTKPALSKRLPYFADLSKSDRKVALYMFDRLWAATDSQDWGTVRDELRDLVASRVVSGPWKENGFGCLAYHYLVAESLADVQFDGGPARDLPRFQRWLIGNPAFTSRFVSALTPADNAAGALGILYELASVSPDAVLTYPDLAIGMAIVFDTDHSRPDQRFATFDWIVRNQGSLAYDLRDMPHELTRYLVDVPVTPIERAWAYDQFQGVKSLAKAYRALDYDSDALSGKVPKRIEGRAYTLMNLHAYGGTCMDQTYFTSQVGRILGYPVAAIRHSGPGITGHTWCLQFAPEYKQPPWREIGGSGFGWVRDPATDRRATDQGMAFAVQSLAFERSRRELAAIFARIARRVPGWVRSDVPAGPDVLAAVVYAKPRGGQLEPSTRRSSRYYRAERPFKPTWLLEKAFDLDPFQPAVWDAVEALGRDKEISADELIGFVTQLQQRAGDTFPDVGHLAVLNVYSALPPDRAIALLQAAGNDLTKDQQNRTPLLAGELWLAIGDLYAANEKPRDALISYERAVLVDPAYPPTVIRALERGLKVSRESGIDDRILPVCQQVFDEFREPLFGKAIGDELARAGMPAQAVTWYRHVFNQTRRDDSGRYDALRAAIDLLYQRTRFRTAAVWSAELYDQTGHPDDGRRWADALAAGGHTRDAAVVMQQVAIAEAERQRELNEDAAKRARRSR